MARTCENCDTALEPGQHRWCPPCAVHLDWNMSDLTAGEGLNLGGGVRLRQAPGGGHEYVYSGPMHP